MAHTATWLALLLFCGCTTEQVRLSQPPIELCRDSESGYLSVFWSSLNHEKVVSTLHSRFPATEDNLLCLIPADQRIMIEPKEKDL